MNIPEDICSRLIRKWFDEVDSEDTVDSDHSHEEVVGFVVDEESQFLW